MDEPPRILCAVCHIKMRLVECPACKGTGEDPYQFDVDCPQCDGNGAWFECPDWQNHPKLQEGELKQNSTIQQLPLPTYDCVLCGFHGTRNDPETGLIRHFCSRGGDLSRVPGGNWIPNIMHILAQDCPLKLESRQPATLQEKHESI